MGLNNEDWTDFILVSHAKTKLLISFYTSETSSLSPPLFPQGIPLFLIASGIAYYHLTPLFSLIFRFLYFHTQLN